MAVYALFVFRYYRFVSARDMFELDLSQYEESRFPTVRTALHAFFYVLKYLVLFPVFAFFWFAVLTLILSFLSRGQSFPETLLMAFATVSVIRVTAYYHEDLSSDLAKMLPFAVLAIFLIDASFFTVSESLDVLKQADDYREQIFYYLLFLIVLELVLRCGMGAGILLFNWRGSGRSGTTADAAAVDAPVADAPAVAPPETVEESDEENAPADRRRLTVYRRRISIRRTRSRRE